MMRPVPLIVAGVIGAAVGIFAMMLLNLHDNSPSQRLEGDGIGIPELVNRVRQELIESEEARIAGKLPPLLRAKSVDLEISFVAKRSAEAGSKVNLEVVEVGSKLGIGTERAHRMTLHLDVQQAESLVIPPSN